MLWLLIKSEGKYGIKLLILYYFFVLLIPNKLHGEVLKKIEGSSLLEIGMMRCQ
jgi:hypothetical protein